jgi:hypothetical protein
MTPRAPQQAIALTPKRTALVRDLVYRIEILEDPPVVAVTTSGDAPVSGWPVSTMGFAARRLSNTTDSS